MLRILLIKKNMGNRCHSHWRTGMTGVCCGSSIDLEAKELSFFRPSMERKTREMTANPKRF